MRLQWIGDALDHWKGSLLETLQTRGILEDFCVDPMATDLAKWRASDYATYADLLRVDSGQVVRHRKPLTDPGAYFHELPPVQDAFLDPDTGVATGRVRKPEQYVRGEDIWRWLLNGTNRMIAVYQHVRAIPTAKRVDQVVSHVGGPERLSWCSYESGTVAMLFFSLAAHRIELVERAFLDTLGRHGRLRVRADYKEGAA